MELNNLFKNVYLRKFQSRIKSYQNFNCNKYLTANWKKYNQQR
jgi:hypothetical protein